MPTYGLKRKKINCHPELKKTTIPSLFFVCARIKSLKEEIDEGI